MGTYKKPRKVKIAEIEVEENRIELCINCVKVKIADIETAEI